MRYKLKVLQIGNFKILKFFMKNYRYSCLGECVCGSIKSYPVRYLKSEHTKSCGCLKGKFITEKIKTHGHSIGKRVSKEYESWRGIKRRCYKKNSSSYKYYGGRGIKVCSRWLNSFENFYKDMGKCPKGYSIERINNNGNYEPNNCKWATIGEQNRNRRNNIYITYNGKTMILKDWAKYLKIDHTLLIYHYKIKNRSMGIIIRKFVIKRHRKDCYG